LERRGRAQDRPDPQALRDWRKGKLFESGQQKDGDSHRERLVASKKASGGCPEQRVDQIGEDEPDRTQSNVAVNQLRLNGPARRTK
jgi:hypothetical protein